LKFFIFYFHLALGGLVLVVYATGVLETFEYSVDRSAAEVQSHLQTGIHSIHRGCGVNLVTVAWALPILSILALINAWPRIHRKNWALGGTVLLTIASLGLIMLLSFSGCLIAMERRPQESVVEKTTLLRFYILHVVVFPVQLAGCFGMLGWVYARLCRRSAGVSPLDAPPPSPPARPETPDRPAATDPNNR
jgi:hypothetical protein